MAVDHVTLGLTSIGDAILAAMDTAASAGYVKLQTAAQATDVITLTFPTTAGAVNSTTGVLTFECTTPALTGSSTIATTKTVTKAGFYSGGGVEVMNCDVGIGSGDIQLSNNVIAQNDTVSITSLTYTPPA